MFCRAVEVNGRTLEISCQLGSSLYNSYMYMRRGSRVVYPMPIGTGISTYVTGNFISILRAVNVASFRVEGKSWKQASLMRQEGGRIG